MDEDSDGDAPQGQNRVQNTEQTAGAAAAAAAAAALDAASLAVADGAAAAALCRDGAVAPPHKKELSRKRNLIKETDSTSSASKPLYKHQNHSKKAFIALNKFRDSARLLFSPSERLRMLCDVQLVADVVEVAAHKAVLSACSPYFNAMFTCELAESSSSRVVLQEIDGQALAALVAFMYSGEIQVSEESVQSLLPAASLLQLVEVEEACCDFLQSQLHPSNCLGISAFADLHSCRDLHTVAVQYTEQHFTEVAQHDEFLGLSVTQLCRLLSSDRLYVKCEEQVYEAAIRWLRYEKPAGVSSGNGSGCSSVSPSGPGGGGSGSSSVICSNGSSSSGVGGSRRLHLAPQVFEHVRLPLLHEEYLLQRIEDEELLRSDSRCKDLLIEALRYHLLTKGGGCPAGSSSSTMALNASGDCMPAIEASPGCLSPATRQQQQHLSLFRSPRTRMRTPVGLPKVLLVFGGQAPKAIRSVEVYDFREDRWYQAAEMPSRRCRCGVAVLDNIVYALGGFNGSLRVRTVDCYDPVKDVWAPVASMEARRSTIGAGVVDGLIYAVGGFDGSTGLNSAEVYNPQTNEWRFIASMSTRRSSVGVGVVKGRLYAVGGYDGVSRQCLATVEAYDPKADVWSPVAEMNCRRSGAGMGVSADGLLYAVGGHDGPLVRKSVEVYNPELDIWTQVADMHLCRRNAGVVWLGGCLYVIGGDDGSTNLNSLECYDAKTNTWTLLDTCMMTGRSYAGVAIVDKYL